MLFRVFLIELWRFGKDASKKSKEEPDLVVDGNVLVEEDWHDVPHVVADLLSCARRLNYWNKQTCK